MSNFAIFIYVYLSDDVKTDLFTYKGLIFASNRAEQIHLPLQLDTTQFLKFKNTYTDI